MKKPFFILFLFFSSFSIFGQSKKITTDDYPVTNEMLRNNHSTRAIEEVVSLDKSWFKNLASKEVLIVELATDFHRYMIYHFSTNAIPEHLINNLGLHTLVNNTYVEVGMNKKQATLAKFIDSANIINSSYFKTKKGFSLGTQKKELQKVYGEPKQCFNSSSYQICIWKFDGDEQDASMTSKKTLAKNSFGYEVTAYFENNKLIAMVLYNAIP